MLSPSPLPDSQTPFTAVINGMDIAAGVSGAIFAAIARLFNGYSVLMFHQQDITDE